MYDLENEGDEAAIAVNLLPLLAREIQTKGEQQSQANKAHK